MRVTIDTEQCMLSGLCVEAEPAAFRQDANGVAHPTDEARELELERLKQRARVCPSGAIEIYDGDELVDPFA